MGREMVRTHQTVPGRESELTSLAQPFNDGPFEIDEPVWTDHRAYKAKSSPSEPVREPVEDGEGAGGSVNTTVSTDSPPESAMPDGIVIITERTMRLARC
jgi:hypothetical protein